MLRFNTHRIRAMLLLATVVAAGSVCPAACAQVERVWLGHRSHDPSKVVVSWTTTTPSESIVRFGTTQALGEEASVAGTRTLHHVEIPVAVKDQKYHYAIGRGGDASASGTFQSWPTEELRVAIVADWHDQPDLSALVNDNVHLLMTAGDNIPGLWQTCGAGRKDCYKPYAALIDAYPDLFRTTPFMPVLGNHDREIRPRGKQPPVEAVYDIEATAFRQFFELPGDEWKWHFDVPNFGVRFVALDFSHTSDFGTTWQTCHDFSRESDQFRWYQALASKPAPFVVTLYNERNASVRNQARGAWRDLFRTGTACITGFGHFAERAEADGVLYFNTSLKGTGNKYPDPKSQVLIGQDNYLLLTFRRATNTLTIALKNLDGKVLDQTAVRGK